MKQQGFYDRMRIVCLMIPEGRVASYGQIAMLCGKPNHSRQVGYGLKHNLAGSDLPAHRVVNGRGEMSGARHFEFPDLQRMLLAQEGVFPEWDGRIWRVDLKKYGWQHTAAETERIEEQLKSIPIEAEE